MMQEEILINFTPRETRVAVVKNGMLQKIDVERSRNRSITGNIYLGTVVRVLPGMQAAFVDIGLERSAFLHAQDLVPPQQKIKGLQQSDPKADIASLLTEGQRILVKVVKNPMSGKGARLTGQISIPSCTLVYLPGTHGLRVAQSVQDTGCRERLLQRLQEAVENSGAGGGFILRTAGISASVDEMESDIGFLTRMWNRIHQQVSASQPPALVHRDFPLAVRTVRDLMWENVGKVRVDSMEMFEQMHQFLQEVKPGVLGRIEYYPDAGPIFDLYGIEDEIQKALHRKVMLKSGGYLVIEKTEAMTTVDINTGSFVGRRNLEETIFKTNMEAAVVLARQLRVRNLGGIILVDFIDMAMAEHRDRVMRTLEYELSRDRNKAQVNEMTALGLVEITRKRTSESLEEVLTEICPACDGRGIQKSRGTICYEIFREMLRTARESDAAEYLIVASQPIVDWLQEEEAAGLADLEAVLERKITVRVKPGYYQEQYDVVPV